jgi:hypothetical protein
MRLSILNKWTRINIKKFSDNGNIFGIMLQLLQQRKHHDNIASINDERKYMEHKSKEHKRYLDAKKVDILDKYVFQSMAYLTYFFKYVSTYKDLNKIFGNDIKDLLGIRVEDTESDEYAFIFSDLLRSILSMDLYEKDFRLRLIHILQEIIWEKVDHYLSHIHENRILIDVVHDDFKRVSAWTAMLAESIDQTAEDKRRPHRTINFAPRLSLDEPTVALR